MFRCIVRAQRHPFSPIPRVADRVHSPTAARLHFPTSSLLYRHTLTAYPAYPKKAAAFHSTARNDGGPLIPILASLFKVRHLQIHFVSILMVTSFRRASNWFALPAELYSHSFRC